MKTFFPDLPLNSGFYRVMEIIAPQDTVVSAKWPVAVTGFLMPFEKIMNSTYEIWSKHHAAARHLLHLQYRVSADRRQRHARPEKPIFMFYDWLPGGWGGRNGKDGANVMQASFGTGMLSQPVEGQERGNPILTTEFEAMTNFAGPGKWRGGVGARKTCLLREAENTVISYICDRERAVVWGTNGGLPSMPHGLHIRRAGANETHGSAPSFRTCRCGPAIFSAGPRLAAAATAIRSNAIPKG